MKKLIVIIVLSASNQLLAQQVDNNLYALAINKIAIEVASNYPTLKSEDTLFLKLPHLKTFMKPSKSGSLYLKYYDTDWLGANRGIPVFFLQPVTNKGSELILNFDIMYYSSAEKDIMWSAAGGGYVKYSFDCKKNTFEIIETIIAP